MADTRDRPVLDIMYDVATPEPIAKWTDAKKGELDELGLTPEAHRTLIHDNARELFRL